MAMRAGPLVRWVSVTLGIIALTSVTVDATLNEGGVSQSALGILATSLTEENAGACPEGMTPITTASGDRCIDIYEVSPSSACPFQEPTNMLESQDNVTNASCVPVSVPDAMPWRQVTREQASLACAKAGKRLPTNEEWYRAALGTPDLEGGDLVCNIKGQDAKKTGSHSSCVSSAAVYDMIGNVWEWVDGDVYEGTYNGRALPDSGYVTQVDSNGVAVYTADSPDALLFADYAWANKTGVFGMIRGGYYGNGSDAGVYAVNAYMAPTTPGTAVGFRCIK